MKRALILSIPMLTLVAPVLAEDVPALTAAVVDAKKPASRASATKAPATDSAADKDTNPRNEESSKPPGDVQMSGMSVLGNDEAPKSLVLVPWKSSQLGDAPGLSKMLDDSTQPVDKDVFMRELGYYQIKIDSK